MLHNFSRSNSAAEIWKFEIIHPSKAKNSRSGQTNISQSLCSTGHVTQMQEVWSRLLPVALLLAIILQQHLLLTFQPPSFVLVFNLLLGFVHRQTIHINEHVLKGGFFRNTGAFYFSPDELGRQHSHNMATSSTAGLTQQVTAPSNGQVDYHIPLSNFSCNNVFSKILSKAEGSVYRHEQTNFLHRCHVATEAYCRLMLVWLASFGLLGFPDV